MLVYCVHDVLILNFSVPSVTSLLDFFANIIATAIAIMIIKLIIAVNIIFIFLLLFFLFHGVPSTN